MKSAHFDVEPDGFYGAYWKSEQPSDCALIAMLGDDPEDYLARSAVKWMSRQGINVMTMSPAKKDYGHHNYPLERIETLAQSAWQSKNRHCGRFDNGHACADSRVVFSEYHADHRHDAQRFHLAGVHAGQKGWLWRMADRGRIALFLSG